MKTRNEIAAYIRDLRSVKTDYLTIREKNRVIRAYARRFAALSLDGK